MKIILLGAPGSGKGTISENLVRDFGFYHLSTGELLRGEIAKGTKLGKEIDSLLKKGQLFPDEKMIPMVKAELKNKENYILDGFPRTIPQAQAIEDLKIDLVLRRLLLDEGEQELNHAMAVAEVGSGERLIDRPGGKHLV